MAEAAACCAQFFRYSPFSFPVQPQSTELPATTEGRWRRRHLSPGHKAGLLTVLLTCTGCAFQVTPGVEKGVTLCTGDQPKNWTHDSDTLAVPFFNFVYGILVCLRACPLAPFLSSGLRRSSLSLDLELRVHGACPLLARHRFGHLEGRRESSMVCTLFSLTPLYGVQLLPR